VGYVKNDISHLFLLMEKIAYEFLSIKITVLYYGETGNSSAEG